ncbi:TIGR03503 family protein [Photobacterium sp. 1_MG-2023]|uniref:TIGR03503 family protein n=1 Tax=Photobacterium sp. 1_MG-2023 TaxID=3062646 RepID=UPI0026E1754B|nr:TIGR03503 family protein [Photobacterium sp. 1_MG-2023]MDO6708470.1 TIGR03503 family protein [Photobacterium sp. 1_MG-2023]
MRRLALLSTLIPALLGAQSASAASWLDNRFRVDPTIKQVAFVVERETKNQNVVLVRPDGVKYYPWRHPDNVAWHEEAGMDIITIENPMPGPWQAVGKVSTKNQVKVLSNLKLDVATLPERFYQTETYKFTARLTQDDQLLTDRDFLDRVKMSVYFYEYVDDPEALAEDALPTPLKLGEFSDDGLELDEAPGDGVFTVALPIEIQPGRYRVKMTSGNGIFLRTYEQEVMVYPPPLLPSFIQARNTEENHTLVVTSDEGMIQPGSLSVHLDQEAPDGSVTVSQEQAAPDATRLEASVPNLLNPGSYAWSGWLYATDTYQQRALVFPMQKSHFAITSVLHLDKNLAEYRAQQEEKARLEEEKRRLEAQLAARSQTWNMILGGNAVIVLLAAVWVFLRRRRHRSAASEQDEPRLEIPPDMKV